MLKIIEQKEKGNKKNDQQLVFVFLGKIIHNATKLVIFIFVIVKYINLFFFFNDLLRFYSILSIYYNCEEIWLHQYDYINMITWIWNRNNSFKT